ncbi:sulfotransferase 1E1-like [Epargyreus clarus]|uniref:sulfotransferase 1E1-like n=1 Tax=Epargyreus clarus TaxID=520877 RepID=UPI003C2C04F7
MMEGENKIKFPFEYRVLGPEEAEAPRNYYSEFLTEFIRLGSTGYFFFKEFDTMALDIYNMPLRPSDTFVVTFPRSGTTWTQELVWLLQTNLDFEGAKAIPLTIRFPFIESRAFTKLNFPPDMFDCESFEKFQKEFSPIDPENLKTLSSPRFIKSHIPLSLLPPSLLETTKVVYVARNPRDVVVSTYYHMKSSRIIPPDREFKPFWKLFMESKVLWSPFFEHVKEAWRLRNHPNMAFIFYEELSKDLMGVARRLAKFFGKDYSEEQFEALYNHLKFDNFKNNKSVNMAEWQEIGIMKDSFIRKGKTGGWRDHFDDEMKQQADRWIEENLRDIDLQFPTD